MRNIEYIIIHHSVTGYPNDESTAKNIIKRQMEEYNKGLLPSPYSNTYHYIITRDGKQVNWVCECNVSGHCGVDEINKKSIGICLLGNFEIETPSQAQLNKLIELLKILYKKYKFKDILGHKDVLPTTQCPGKNLYSLIPLIKKEVFNMIEKWEEEVIKNAFNKGWIKNLDIHLQKAKEPFTRAETLAVLMNFTNTIDKDLIKKVVVEVLKEMVSKL